MTHRRDVRGTFERIAEPFARTREHPWPEVETFLVDRRAATALDLGCGNGRHSALLAERANRVLAVDAAKSLLSVSRRRSAEEGWTAAHLLGDAAALPLATGSVELGLYIATLHHLPSRELRVASLDELARVLAAGGSALVSAWSTEHERFDRSSGFDTTVEWTLADGEAVDRFYHIYDPDEFDRDLGASDLEVTTLVVSSGNCYAVVEA